VAYIWLYLKHGLNPSGLLPFILFAYPMRSEDYMKAYNLQLRFSKYFCLLALVGLIISPPSYGQQSAGSIDSATVSADKVLGDATRTQLQDLVNQRDSFQLEVNKSEQKDDNFRNYAEQRVQALMKLKEAGGSPSRSLSKEKQGELYALQHWLDQDTQARTQDQARIQQLDQAIANLQQSQLSTLQAMKSDIHNMRVDADAQTADQKFQQQMSINYFNELQSEMGAASWGRPPTDGTLNTQSGTLNRLFRGGGGQGGYGGYAVGGYNY